MSQSVKYDLTVGSAYNSRNVKYQKFGWESKRSNGLDGKLVIGFKRSIYKYADTLFMIAFNKIYNLMYKLYDLFVFLFELSNW